MLIFIIIFTLKDRKQQDREHMQLRRNIGHTHEISAPARLRRDSPQGLIAIPFGSTRKMPDASLFRESHYDRPTSVTSTSRLRGRLS